MQIVDVKITAIEIPFDKPGWTSLTWPPVPVSRATRFAILRILTDEGITGISMSGRGLVEDYVKPSLIGKDPSDIEGILSSLPRYGVPKPGFIEIALWDIIGKASGQPIYKLLGGWCREKIKVYVSMESLKKPDDTAEFALNYLEKGFKAIKLRLHRPDPVEDLEVVKAVRGAVGDDMDIMADANQAHITFWSHRTALKMAKALEKLDVIWLEEPLSKDDIEGYVNLVNSVEIPIAGAERESNLYRFREILSRGALDIIQPDEIYVGGITRLKKIANLAEAFLKTCILHCPRWAGLQLIATIPNCTYAEWLNDTNYVWHYWSDKLLKNPITIRDGYVKIPSEPGLGIELNMEYIKKHIIHPHRMDLEVTGDRGPTVDLLTSTFLT